MMMMTMLLSRKFKQIRFNSNMQVDMTSCKICFVERWLIKILQNSQKNTCAGLSLFNKDAGCWPVTLAETDPQHASRPVAFPKIFRKLFLRKKPWWLVCIDRITKFSISNHCHSKIIVVLEHGFKYSQKALNSFKKDTKKDLFLSI